MGRKIIIPGADFSQNGIIGEIIPEIEFFGYDLTGETGLSVEIGSGNYTWIFSMPVNKNAKIRSIICRGGNGSGTVILKIFNPPSSGVFNQDGSDYNIYITTNEKKTLDNPISIQAGQYIGYQINTSIWYLAGGDTPVQYYADGLVSSVNENSVHRTIHSVEFELIV